MRKNTKLTIFVALVVTCSVGLSFFAGYNKKNKRVITSDNDCLACHSDMKSAEKLSDKSRGETGIIFFHSTHYKNMKISCLSCHGKDTYHTKNVSMELCLTCHDNVLAANDCSSCHRPTPAPDGQRR
jgi:hypothetical protein